ncbi:MAG: serine protease [Solirubrobacteraceae bacterium]
MTPAATPSSDAFEERVSFFGRRGTLLTAAHVVDDATHELAVALAAADGTCRMWSLQRVERHPNEDVAVGIVPLPTESVPGSPIQLSTDAHHSSGEWMVWGYPEDAMYDLVFDGRAVARQTCLRERLYPTAAIRNRSPSSPRNATVRVRGLAGPGVSGGPVILRYRRSPDWPAIGVYIGERIAVHGGLFVSHVACLDELCHWIPETLERSLAEEASAIR